MKTQKHIKQLWLGGILALTVLALHSCLSAAPSKQDALGEYMSQNAVIIDVRTPAEFEMGSAEGSLNIPLSSLEGQLDSLKSLGRPLILVCKSGVRAQAALELATNQGVDAINAGSWQSIPKKK